MSRGKHRIFRYLGRWCGICARCHEVMTHDRWSGTLDLLALHVDEHRPLTTAGS